MFGGVELEVGVSPESDFVDTLIVLGVGALEFQVGCVEVYKTGVDAE